MSRAGLLVAIALGCGGGGGGPPEVPAPPGDALRASCDEALHAAARTGLAGEEPHEEALRARDQMIESCVATRWSPDVRACLREGATQDALRACTERLTPAQRDELLDRLTAAGLMRREEAPPPGATAPP